MGENLKSSANERPASVRSELIQHSAVQSNSAPRRMPEQRSVGRGWTRRPQAEDKSDGISVISSSMDLGMNDPTELQQPVAATQSTQQLEEMPRVPAGRIQLMESVGRWQIRPAVEQAKWQPISAQHRQAELAPRQQVTVTRHLVTVRPLMAIRPMAAGRPPMTIRPLMAITPMVASRPLMAIRPMAAGRPHMTIRPLMAIRPMVASRPLMAIRPMAAGRPPVEARSPAAIIRPLITPHTKKTEQRPPTPVREPVPPRLSAPAPARSATSQQCVREAEPNPTVFSYLESNKKLHDEPKTTNFFLVEETGHSPSKLNPVDRRINFNLAPGDELVQCPYEPGHLILRQRFVLHLVKCRKSYVKRCMAHKQPIQIEICKYSTDHHFPTSKIKEHENTCPHRIDHRELEEQLQAASISDQESIARANSNTKVNPNLEAANSPVKESEGPPPKPQPISIFAMKADEDEEDWDAPSDLQSDQPGYNPQAYIEENDLHWAVSIPGGFSRKERKAFRERRIQSYKRHQEREAKKKDRKEE